MKNITLLGKAIVKQIVTDSYKEDMVRNIQNKLNQVEFTIKIFQDEMQKTLNKLIADGYPQLDVVKKEFAKEEEKLFRQKKHLLDKIKYISSLKINEEIVQDTFNYPVEVKVGDNFAQVISREIILKDGEVIKIS